MMVIREERQRKRVTLEELTNLGGFNRSTLTRYLYEERDVPIAALYRIALALNIEASEIVARAEANVSAPDEEIDP